MGTLVVLKLANNKIKTLAELDNLKDLKNLKSLDLADNEVTKVEGYEEKVWDMLEGLDIPDNHNRDGESKYTEDDDDYGSDLEGDSNELGEVVPRGPAFIDDEYGDEGFEGGEDDELDDFDDEEKQNFDGKDANKRAKN